MPTNDRRSVAAQLASKPKITDGLRGKNTKKHQHFGKFLNFFSAFPDALFLSPFEQAHSLNPLPSKGLLPVQHYFSHLTALFLSLCLMIPSAKPCSARTQSALFTISLTLHHFP